MSGTLYKKLKISRSSIDIRKSRQFVQNGDNDSSSSDDISVNNGSPCSYRRSSHKTDIHWSNKSNTSSSHSLSSSCDGILQSDGDLAHQTSEADEELDTLLFNDQQSQQKSYNYKTVNLNHSLKLLHSPIYSPDILSDSKTGSSLINDICQTNNGFELNKLQMQFSNGNETAFRCSTPIQFLEGVEHTLNADILSNECEDESDSSISQSTTSSDEKVLYEGASMSFKKFGSKFIDLSLQHHLSDLAQQSILSFISDCLPHNASLPTMYSLKKIRAQYSKGKYVSLKNNEFHIPDIESQLFNICQRNIASIMDFISVKEFHCSDISNGTIYKKTIANQCCQNALFLHLIINSDGAPIVASSNKNIWPILLSIVELPYKLRRYFRNIVLGGLWCGCDKPDWNIFLESFIEQMNMISAKMIKIKYENRNIFLKFNIIALIADLPAKASILNCKQFNGDYGCILCLQKGIYCDNRHLYPYDNDMIYRTNKDYCDALCLVLCTSKPAFGIKGECLLSSLIQIPEMVPIDIMHQLYLGVTKSIVYSIYNSKKTILDKDKFKKACCTIKLPSDFHRRPRTFEHLKHWKAIEYKYFLLYYGSAVLHDNVSDEYYVHFLILCTSICMLFESQISPEDIALVEKLLCCFVKSMPVLYGKYAETHNVHSLLHLPRQAQLYGALWHISAMTFEGALHNLQKYITGTTDMAGQIVKRFLCHQKLAQQQEHIVNTQLLGPCHVDDPDWKHIINKAFDTCGTSYEYYSRAIIHGKIYSTEEYDADKKSCSHFVKFYDNLSKTVKFGSILSFVGKIDAVIIEIYQNVGTLLDTIVHPLFNEFDKSIFIRNTCIFENSHTVVCVPLSCITNRCVWYNIMDKQCLLIAIVNDYEHN